MTDPYPITKDQYFTRNQPAKSEEIKNRVLVKYIPLVIEGDIGMEIYRSPEPISLTKGAEIEIEAEYSNVPCIDCSGDLENKTGSTFSITVENYYSWGAIVTVKNTGTNFGTCELVLSGTLLTESETDYEIAEDLASIAENGTLEYKFSDNHLIQTAENAAAIAAALISSYATPRKDVSLNWRGDMALELGDEITVPVYQRGTTTVNDDFYVYKNKLDFDGTLKAATDGRKIPTTVTTEGA